MVRFSGEDLSDEDAIQANQKRKRGGEFFKRSFHHPKEQGMMLPKLLFICFKTYGHTGFLAGGSSDKDYGFCGGAQPYWAISSKLNPIGWLGSVLGASMKVQNPASGYPQTFVASHHPENELLRIVLPWGLKSLVFQPPDFQSTREFNSDGWYSSAAS